MNLLLELCAKAVIQHLDGDMKLFNNYKNRAISLYEEQKFDESCNYPLKYMIAEEIKEQLYEMMN